MKRWAPLVALCMLVVSGSCTSGGERPTVEQVADALQADETTFNQPLTAAEARCIARIIVDSDLSDEAVRAIAEYDDAYTEEDEDLAALVEIAAQAREDCLSD